MAPPPFLWRAQVALVAQFEADRHGAPAGKVGADVSAVAGPSVQQSLLLGTGPGVGFNAR